MPARTAATHKLKRLYWQKPRLKIENVKIRKCPTLSQGKFNKNIRFFKAKTLLIGNGHFKHHFITLN